MVENDNVCFWCDVVLSNTTPHGVIPLDTARTVDHFIPKSRGGKNSRSNYIPSCNRCNQMRGAISPAIFCDVMDRCNPQLTSTKYVHDTAKHLIENGSKGISEFKGLMLPFYNHLILPPNLINKFSGQKIIGEKCNICQCGLTHKANAPNAVRSYVVQTEDSISEFLLCRECRDLIGYTDSAAALRLAAEETGFEKFKMMKINDRKKLADSCLVFLKNMLRANEYKGLPV